MNALEQSLAYVPNEHDLGVVRNLPVDCLPKISVIIPSFNQAEFLSETLESVFSQGYPNLEIFVADGGSADGTTSILQQFQGRYKGLLRYVSESDHGQYQAVNKGIDATTGEIIAWINSDDVYLPETFWKIVSFFHFNRCAFVVYGRNRYTDEHLVPKMDYPVDWSPILREQRRRMMHFCLPPQPSLFFKRVATVLSGKLKSPILDYEMWLRWQQDMPFYFIDDYLSLSRLHAEAKTVKSRRQLIHGICKVVHNQYLTVPSSWTFSRAFNEAYGNGWVSGEVLPVTTLIRIKTLLYWAYYNLRWSPRTLWRGIDSCVRIIRESLYGRR